METYIRPTLFAKVEKEKVLLELLIRFVQQTNQQIKPHPTS